MSATKFHNEYKRLDSVQKQAVDHIFGPLLVLAGPGTGKTHVITMRIANILRKTDTDPDRILALTFTDAAAKEMKKRLFDLIGYPALRVKISTFHGFCNEILETYPQYASIPMGSRPIEELEGLGIIEEIIDALPLRSLKPYGSQYYFLPYIRRRIQDLKQEAISPEEFKKRIDKRRIKLASKANKHTSGKHKGKERADMLIDEQMLQKNKELGDIYKAYEKELRTRKLYDFSDMLLLLIAAIKKHRTLARILREAYEFILVDEHQDTNNAQQQLIELLLQGIPEPNICVVGDEKQAIYRFQGGSMENFLYFKKKFPSAQGVLLRKNFRSKQGLLDATHALAEKISSRSAALIAANQKDKKSTRAPIRLIRCKTPAQELSCIARDIRARIDAGTIPEDIAILYRDNKDGTQLHQALDQGAIAHNFETERDIFADPYVRSFLKILSAVAHIGDERKVIEALHVACFGIEPHLLYGWMRESSEKRASIFSLNIPALTLLESLARTDANEHITKTLEEIGERTGLLADMLASPQGYEHVRNIRVIWDVAKEAARKNPNATSKDLLVYLDRLQEHGLQLLPKEKNARHKGVRCMTAHKAKGREFEHVYIIHAYDGHWGNRSIRDPLPFAPDLFSSLRDKAKESGQEDEMRLLYVACTRAKSSLTISYPQESFSGREVMPSGFLDMLDAKHIARISENLFEEDVLTLPKKKKKDVVKKEEQELFWELMQQRGISVTAVNNFYDCAWRYIYMNLLRIPKRKEKWEIFGTAIHAALKDFFKAYARKKTSQKYLLDRFAHHLASERLGKDLHNMLLEKGTTALGAYWDNHPQGWHKKYLLELSIPHADAGYEVTIQGKLDKVELYPQSVRVIDYKTGKPKSRNDIEGKTRTGSGGIKRQLVFYKLLLESLPQSTYVMQEGEIEFIEAPKGAKNRSQIFEISDADMKRLKGEIKDMIRAVREGSYETFACNKKDCEFCELRREIEKHRR